MILTISLLAPDWPEAGTRSENRLMDETGGAQRLSDTRIQTGLENFSISSIEQVRAHVWRSDAVHGWLNEGMELMVGTKRTIWQSNFCPPWLYAYLLDDVDEIEWGDQ